MKQFCGPISGTWEWISMGGNREEGQDTLGVRGTEQGLRKRVGSRLGAGASPWLL